jgi:hypothetical protein
MKKNEKVASVKNNYGVASDCLANIKLILKKKSLNFKVGKEIF